MRRMSRISRSMFRMTIRRMMARIRKRMTRIMGMVVRKQWPAQPILTSGVSFLRTLGGHPTSRPQASLFIPTLFLFYFLSFSDTFFSLSFLVSLLYFYFYFSLDPGWWICIPPTSFSDLCLAIRSSFFCFTFFLFHFYPEFSLLNRSDGGKYI